MPGVVFPLWNRGTTQQDWQSCEGSGSDAPDSRFQKQAASKLTVREAAGGAERSSVRLPEPGG